MLSRSYKLRFRRRLRLQKRQVEQLGAQAERHLETNFFKRLERLVQVRRFVLTWLLLVVILIGSLVAQNRNLSGYYQTVQPVPGGTYTEGILGAFTNANPLYATDVVDASVSKLLFSGLMTYNEQNQLVGDLAESITPNDRGTVYTIKLRPKLSWHDGQPLTAQDVVFTYHVIQNPDARSPLFNSWRGIKVEAPDDNTVVFTLPNSLASFPYSLTNGIVPKHLLDGVAMADMRSVPFNTANPVGSGPFMWQALQVTGQSLDDRQEYIALKVFSNYYAGEPKLNGFVIRSFRNSQALVKAFEDKEVNAVVGLTEVPLSVEANGEIRSYNMLLTAQVMSFFRMSHPLFGDTRVRQALIQGVDITKVTASLPYSTMPVRQPFNKGQHGYNPAYWQFAYDPGRAAALLDEAGWKLGPDGLRYNNGTKLSFMLSTQTGEYEMIARVLQEQWRAIGVNAEVDVAPDAATFQNTLAGHGYEALLYGISLGVDPDVFVYWHSSQADVLAPVRLNFSEYKSATADASLEAGRTRADPALRAVKYQPLLQAWQKDMPALGLYQPRFLYLTRGPVYGLKEHLINTDAERFTNVHNWMIRTAYKTPE